MKPFEGFQRNMRFTPLPNVFFSRLLPEIDDLCELKVLLHIFRVLYQKNGYPKYVSDAELLGDEGLMAGVGGERGLRNGLAKAVQRGALLKLGVEREGDPMELYFLNSDVGREACAKIASGEIDIGVSPRREACNAEEQTSNIFELYERNIGMLTPMIAEELKEAEQLYPYDWIEEAFRESVSHNKRSWKYIEAILKRWSSEGKGHGKPGRDSKEDPDKYIKGRYGHVVRR